MKRLHQVSRELIEHYCLMKQPSVITIDAHEHIDTLRRYALKCDHITEMGFRFGSTFTGFLMGQPSKLVTYDIQINQSLVDLFKTMRGRTDCHFNQANTLDVEIEETDLLFIDTLHTYHQLSRELEMHSPKVLKWIILHDTETFGLNGEDNAHPGLLRAVTEFLETHKAQWHLKERFYNCNGLIVLERTGLL